MERERQGNKYYVPWKSVFVRRFYLRRRCRIVSSLLTKQLIDGLSDWLLRLPFWPIGRQFWLIIYVTDWTLTISSVHSYVCLPSDFDWQFKRATPSFASSTSLMSPHDFLIRLMTWNLKGQFQNKTLKRRSNKELIYSRLQTTRKADKKKFSENHARAEERQGIRTCKHCFQYPIPVYQLLVYTMIVWLRASKVKQTWRAFETPTPHILPFGHEKRFFWKWADWGN